MLQNRGKVQYQRLILKIYLKIYLGFFHRLLMMMTLCLVGKERQQRGWKMIQDKKLLLIKNKWPDEMNAIEKNQNKLLLNYKCSTLSKRDLPPGFLRSDGPQKLVPFLSSPSSCSNGSLQGRSLMWEFLISESPQMGRFLPLIQNRPFHTEIHQTRSPRRVTFSA